MALLAGGVTTHLVWRSCAPGRDLLKVALLPISGGVWLGVGGAFDGYSPVKALRAVGAVLLVVALGGWMSACTYQDHPADGKQACSSSGQCPVGYFCAASDNKCWRNGETVGDGGAGSVDARNDRFPTDRHVVTSPDGSRERTARARVTFAIARSTIGRQRHAVRRPARRVVAIRTAIASLP